MKSLYTWLVMLSKEKLQFKVQKLLGKVYFVIYKITFLGLLNSRCEYVY